MADCVIDNIGSNNSLIAVKDSHLQLEFRIFSRGSVKVLCTKIGLNIVVGLGEDEEDTSYLMRNEEEKKKKKKQKKRGGFFFSLKRAR